MEMFRQASTIMALGMTLVFLFLGGVILAVDLAARIIHHFEGPPTDDEAEPAGRADGMHRRAAAIAVALHRFTNKD